MPAQPRFTPLGQSGSNNGFGPIIGAGDIPAATPSDKGPVDLMLTHYRFTDRLAPGSDIEYDDNGNVKGVDGGDWLNQQIAKLIQSEQDSAAIHPEYGTMLSALVGQKLTGSFSDALVQNNVRTAVLLHKSKLATEPGVTNDQIVDDILDVFIEPIQDDPRNKAIIVSLKTRSGQVTMSGNVVTL